MGRKTLSCLSTQKVTKRGVSPRPPEPQIKTHCRNDSGFSFVCGDCFDWRPRRELTYSIFLFHSIPSSIPLSCHAQTIFAWYSSSQTLRQNSRIWLFSRKRSSVLSTHCARSRKCSQMCRGRPTSPAIISQAASRAST